MQNLALFALEARPGTAKKIRFQGRTKMALAKIWTKRIGWNLWTCQLTSQRTIATHFQSKPLIWVAHRSKYVKFSVHIKFLSTKIIRHFRMVVPKNRWNNIIASAVFFVGETILNTVYEAMFRIPKNTRANLCFSLDSLAVFRRQS